MRDSRRWATTWSTLRLLMAVAVLAAVTAQLVATTSTALETGRDFATTLSNFFSFFTILSNLGAAVVLIVCGLRTLARRRRADAVDPRGLAIALAAVSTYMIVTGIVYNALLRSIVLPVGSEPIPWANEVMHLVAPLFLLADVLVGPARRRLAWRSVLAVIVFPIAWVVYTLVRGPLVTDPTGAPPFWYPYPFLNPFSSPGGYIEVSLYVVGIAIAILAVALSVIAVGRRRGADAPPPAPPVRSAAPAPEAAGGTAHF